MTDATAPRSDEDLIAENADTFVLFWREEVQGPDLDYSRASLDDVDAFLGVLHQTGQSLPANLQGLAVAYLCEVARRQYGGAYVEGDGENPYRLAIGDPPAVLLHPFQKVRGRLVNGEEDSLPFYYDGIADHVGTPGLTRLV